MTLAEALAERSALRNEIANTKRRLLRNAAVRDGDAPAEDPIALLALLDATHDRLSVLVQRINRTNSASRTADGQTLMEVLAKRDALGSQVRILQELVDAATERQTPYHTMGNAIPTVNVPEILKRADELARQYRLLDGQIQQANWSTPLAD